MVKQTSGPLVTLYSTPSSSPSPAPEASSTSLRGGSLRHLSLRHLKKARDSSQRENWMIWQGPRRIRLRCWTEKLCLHCFFFSTLVRHPPAGLRGQDEAALPPLEVEIIAGLGLRSMDFMEDSDSYVKVRLGKVEQKTKVCWRSSLTGASE